MGASQDTTGSDTNYLSWCMLASKYQDIGQGLASGYQAYEA